MTAPDPDPNAAAAWIAAHRAWMVGVARNALLDRGGAVDDAEDAVQEAALKLWRRWGAFRPPDPATARGRGSSGSAERARRNWVIAAVTHAAIDRTRARRRRPAAPLVPADPDDPDPVAVRQPADPLDLEALAVRRDLIRWLWPLLPPTARRFAAARGTGYEWTEIARAAGTTSEAARQVLVRQRRVLRAALATVQAQETKLAQVGAILSGSG